MVEFHTLGQTIQVDRLKLNRHETQRKTGQKKKQEESGKEQEESGKSSRRVGIT
jgi:hypothetical protein